MDILWHVISAGTENHKMEFAKKLMKDLLRAFVLGAAVSAGLGVIFFLCGFFSGRFQMAQALETSKNGLLLVAALGIFLVAGMLLVKGKSPEKFREREAWKKQFQILGYKSVIGMICIVVLAAASCLDYILLNIK